MNSDPAQPSAETMRRLRVRLEQFVRAGRSGCTEACFALEPVARAHRDSALDLLYTEFVLREQLGQQPSASEWYERFPDLRAELDEMFRVHEELGGVEAPLPAMRDPVQKNGTGLLAAPAAVPTGSDAIDYELIEEIGRGGMGVVCRARDKRLGRTVAIKFLHGDRAQQPEAIDRFRREARATSALSSPNICTIYEMDEQAGQPFIAMELVVGRTLREAAQAGIALATVVDIAAQASRALAEAHAAGIVHRDIKPGNLMIRSDGCVKVLDFGMARLLQSDLVRPGEKALSLDATTPGTLIGTVAYMSPEQARCEAVGPASDLFSLGVVLYEVVTRRHPFERNTPMATLAAILSEAPLPPASLNPEITGELGALIVRMLAKAPAERPTASEVERSLRMWWAALGAADRSGFMAVTAPSSVSSAASRRTVGRERESGLLEEALAAAASGAGGFRCVAGEPGIGKTTLVDRFLSHLNAHAAVARGRCSERLAGSEAYLPVIEAVEYLLRGDPSGATGHALRTLAPSWHAQLTTTDTPQDGIAAVTGDRLKRELLAFVREITRTRPCVLFLDDLHWADVSTVDLLAYLGAQCSDLRLLIVLTYRPSDLVLARHPLVAVLQELEARGVCHVIDLPFLSDAEIGRYLDTEFHGHAFPVDFAPFLLGKTSGNPLFLVDLLRYLRETHVIARANGAAWTLTRSIPDFQRQLPQSVRSMVQRKIDQLTGDDRRLLTTASVQGHEFDAATVARAMNQDAAEIEDRLEAMTRLHAVIKSAGEVELPDQTLTTRYVFVHVLYQNALFDALQPARKAALAAAVAQAMRKAHANYPEPVAAQLAILFETARDFAAAADQFLTAAENARRLFAHREAAVLARRGLALVARLPDGPARVTLELRLSMALGIALQSAVGYGNMEVKQAFDRARGLCAIVDDVSLQFRSLNGLFWFESARGNFLGAGHELSNELMTIAQTSGDPVFLLHAHLARAVHLMQTGDPAQATTHFEQGFAFYDPARHAGLSHAFGQHPAVMCLGFGALNLSLMARSDRAMAQADAAVSLAERIGDLPTLIFGYFFRLFVAAMRRDPSVALNDGPAYVEQANDAPFFHAVFRAYVGHAEAQSGDVQRGLDELAAALAAFRAAGGLVMVPTFCCLLAELLLGAGRTEDAARAVDEGLAVSLESGNPWFDPELLRLRAVVIHRRGEPAAAAFSAAIEKARTQGAPAFELRAWVDVVHHRVAVPMAREQLAALVESLQNTHHTPDMTAALDLANEVIARGGPFGSSAAVAGDDRERPKGDAGVCCTGNPRHESSANVPARVARCEAGRGRRGGVPPLH